MNNVEKFQSLMLSNCFDSSTNSITALFKNLDISICNEKNIWFYADMQSNQTGTSEKTIDFNLDEMVKGTGYIYVCRIYDDELTIDPIIKNYFDSFIQEASQIKNIKSIQLFIMNNIEVLEHTDSDNLQVQRALFPIEVPDSTANNLIFKIEKNEIIPTPKEVISFSGAVMHSAWNYTSKDWKFLSVDFYNKT
jgi:hypothetical protein